MTTQELIIGHFEKTLSRAEEAELSGLIQRSPDAGALFDRHRSIHSMMTREAAELAPSSALDAAVIGAALGTASEIVGGGVGFWSGAKIAAGISALIMGGVSVFMATTSPDAERVLPATNPPAVRQAPAIESPSLTAPAEAPSAGSQAVETKRAETERKPTAAGRSARSTAKPSEATTTKQTGPLDLNEHVILNEGTKLNEPK